MRLFAAVLLPDEWGRALTLELDRWGCYPEYGPERIVWAGAREVGGTWSELVAHRDTLLAELGMAQAPSCEDLPHITAGRVRQAGVVRGLRDDVVKLRARSIPLSISNVALLSSVLTPAGAVYRAHAQMPVVF